MARRENKPPLPAPERAARARTTATSPRETTRYSTVDCPSSTCARQNEDRGDAAPSRLSRTQPEQCERARLRSLRFFEPIVPLPSIHQRDLDLTRCSDNHAAPDALKKIKIAVVSQPQGPETPILLEKQARRRRHVTLHIPGGTRPPRALAARDRALPQREKCRPPQHLPIGIRKPTKRRRFLIETVRQASRGVGFILQRMGSSPRFRPTGARASSKAPGDTADQQQAHDPKAPHPVNASRAHQRLLIPSAISLQRLSSLPLKRRTAAMAITTSTPTKMAYSVVPWPSSSSKRCATFRNRSSRCSRATAPPHEIRDRSPFSEPRPSSACRTTLSPSFFIAPTFPTNSQPSHHQFRKRREQRPENRQQHRRKDQAPRRNQHLYRRLLDSLLNHRPVFLTNSL